MTSLDDPAVLKSDDDHVIRAAFLAGYAARLDGEHAHDRIEGARVAEGRDNEAGTVDRPVRSAGSLAQLLVCHPRLPPSYPAAVPASAGGYWRAGVSSMAWPEPDSATKWTAGLVST